jgi:M6 family metalloprotease-like protein
LSALIHTEPDSVAGYYQDNSYGKMTLSGNVVGPFLVSRATNCPVSKWLREADAAATAAGVDLAPYDHLIYILPPESESCNFGGQAEMLGRKSWIRGGLNSQGTFSCHNRRLISHELGHNLLGSGHANTPGVEYGDYSSTMSDVYGVNPHFNAPEKERLGWLSDGGVQNVTESGTYTVSELAVPGGVKALKLAVPGSSTDFYYVSYRTAVGLFDGKLFSIYVDKTSVHRASSYGARLLLQNLDDGQSFSDSGIQITQTSHDATTATVTILLP